MLNFTVEPFFCFQCGTDDNIPCGDDASPDNLKECPRDSKYCVYLKATLGKREILNDISQILALEKKFLYSSN